MKSHSSKQAKKGKTTYRTPDQFIYRKCLKTLKNRVKKLR